MRSRRLLLASGALLVGGALTGCSPGKAESAATNGSPAEELEAAARRLNGATVTIQAEATNLGTSMVFAVDPPQRKGTFHFIADHGRDGVMIASNDREIWLWRQSIVIPSKVPSIFHVARDRVAAGSILDLMPADDPTGAARYVRAMKDVQRVGTGYEATIDLSRVPNLGTAIPRSILEKAQALPIKAAIDEKGRLLYLSIDMTTVDKAAGRLDVDYRYIGAPVELELPESGRTVEAPDGVLTGSWSV